MCGQLRGRIKELIENYFVAAPDQARKLHRLPLSFPTLFFSAPLDLLAAAQEAGNSFIIYPIDLSVLRCELVVILLLF